MQVVQQRRLLPLKQPGALRVAARAAVAAGLVAEGADVHAHDLGGLEHLSRAGWR